MRSYYSYKLQKRFIVKVIVGDYQPMDSIKRFQTLRAYPDDVVRINNLKQGPEKQADVVKRVVTHYDKRRKQSI